MNKNNRNFYLYFVIIIGLLLFTVWIGTLRVQGSGYTKGEFEAQLKGGEVAMVNICPNYVKEWRRKASLCYGYGGSGKSGQTIRTGPDRGERA